MFNKTVMVQLSKEKNNKIPKEKKAVTFVCLLLC